LSDPAPDRFESSLCRGASLLREGKFRDAYLLYSEWIRENPECTDAYVGRGRCSAGSGEYHQALEDFNAVLELDPDSAEGLCARARSHAALGNHAAALADLDQSLRLRPDLAEAYCARAIERLRHDQPEAAFEDCTEAIMLRADFAEAYYYRHVACDRLRLKDQAAEDREEAWRLGFRGEPATGADPSPSAGAPPLVELPSSIAEPGLEPATTPVQLSVDSQWRTNARLKEVAAKTSGQAPHVGPARSNTSPGPKLPSPKVFLCYAREDSARVDELCEQLRGAGLDTWMDQTSLQPGDDWDRVIKDRLDLVDYFLVFLSHALFNKPFSYVNKEINLALERQRSARLGVRFVIPVQIDDCPIFPEFRGLQAVRLTEHGKILELASMIVRDFQLRRRA
jgi:hypothetical protein